MGRNIFAGRSASRAACATFAAVVLVGGCGSAGTSGSGTSGSGTSGSGTSGSDTVQTETRDVQGFDSVDFASAGTLTIEQTGTDSLEIEADADILPSLTSEVAGTTLRLGVKPGVNPGNARNITYRMTVGELKGLVVSGAGEITVTALDGAELSVVHSGAARVTVSGRVTSQVVELSGVGEYDGSALESQNADVTVSGTGKAVVNASSTLDARVTGVGSVYLGNPALTQEVTGLGEVTRR
jgi:Putative auto-transporter adhesin, head GIN domain